MKAIALFARTRRFTTALLLALAVAGASAALIPGSTDAVPQKAVFSSFYSDASFSTEVGERIALCNGAHVNWGVITPYQEYYEEPCGVYQDPSDLPGGY